MTKQLSLHTVRQAHSVQSLLSKLHLDLACMCTVRIWWKLLIKLGIELGGNTSKTV